MNPSIYAHTDPRPWVAAWIAHNSEEDPRPLLEWLARGLGLEVDTLQAILRKARRFQLEHTGPLAELIGLDTEAAEYLRRLIALQAAEPRDGAQARRSVWEIYAVKQGIAPVELTRIHREAEVRGPVELALLPALPLLLELPGVELSPEGLEPALLLPPSPAALADLIEDWREGARMGTPDGARFATLAGPGDPGGLGAEVWSGSLELARHSVLAIPAEERNYGVLVWAVDEPAQTRLEAAERRLVRGCRGLVRRSAEAPVGAVYMLLVETHRASLVLRVPDAESRSPVVGGGRRLRRAAKSAIDAGNAPRGGAAQEPDPCLYRFLEFQNYLQSWRSAREQRGHPCSYAWLEKYSGLGGTVCYNLVHGQTKLRPEHIEGLGKVLKLSPPEMAYLEGMCRYAQAKDVASKARARALLARYAAEQGYRTLDGESYRFLSHWMPQVIYELCALPGAYAQRSWVHYALGGRVHWEEAEDALKLLATLGLLDPATGRPRPGAMVGEPESEEITRLAHFRLHESVLHLLQGELLFPAPDRRAQGLVFALPRSVWPAARELHARYLAEVQAIFEAATARGRPDRVLISATQLFPLARRR